MIAEMNRRGTGYTEAAIRTMISAHLCVESTGDGVASYADFTRVGRGQFRFHKGEGPQDLRLLSRRRSARLEPVDDDF